MTNLTAEQIAAIVTTVLAVLPQIAAILGKPEFIKGVRIVSLIWDALAGNYAKAKNQEEKKP